MIGMVIEITLVESFLMARAIKSHIKSSLSQEEGAVDILLDGQFETCGRFRIRLVQPVPASLKLPFHGPDRGEVLVEPLSVLGAGPAADQPGIIGQFVQQTPARFEEIGLPLQFECAGPENPRVKARSDAGSPVAERRIW